MNSDTKRNTIEAIAALAIVSSLTLWVFWGALDAPFHFDDSLFLESAQVASPGDPSRIVSPEQTRQVTYLTFYWNYRLGGTNPRGYHLVNLLLHLGNSLLIYLFVRLLTEGRPDITQGTLQRLLPVAAVGIFALHPIQSEPVNYIYQRSILLAAFFTLLALSIYLWSDKAPDRMRYKWLAVIFWLLAAASKESAWILPLVLVAHIWANAPALDSLRNSLARLRWFLAAVVLLMLSGVAWVTLHLHHGADRSIGSFLSSDSWRYLLSQVQVLATYLRLLIYPTGLTIDHDFQVTSFHSPYGLCCLFLLLGLLTLTVTVRRSMPTLAFLCASFFLFLAPTSSILPSADLLFEHRLYLPMIAASILIAWAILSVCLNLVKRERLRIGVCLGILGIVFAGCAVVSRERTYIWGDNVRLWRDAVAKAPHKARVHYNLGVVYLSESPEEAQKEFLQVSALSPYYANALYNLGWIDQSYGRYDGARKYYLAALKVDPRNWRAHQNLGNLDSIQGRFVDAMSEYRETVRLNPDDWPAYQSLAALQLQEGFPADALATVGKLKELRPDLLEARYLNAVALLESRRPVEAEAELRWVEARDAGHVYGLRIQQLRHQMGLQDGKQ